MFSLTQNLALTRMDSKPSYPQWTLQVTKGKGHLIDLRRSIGYDPLQSTGREWIYQPFDESYLSGIFIKNTASQKSQKWDNPKRTDDSTRRTVIRICYGDNGTMKLSLRPLDIIEDHGWKNFASSTKKTMNHAIQTQEFTKEK